MALRWPNLSLTERLERIRESSANDLCYLIPILPFFHCSLLPEVRNSRAPYRLPTMYSCVSAEPFIRDLSAYLELVIDQD